LGKSMGQIGNNPATWTSGGVGVVTFIGSESYYGSVRKKVDAAQGAVDRLTDATAPLIRDGSARAVADKDDRRALETATNGVKALGTDLKQLRFGGVRATVMSFFAAAGVASLEWAMIDRLESKAKD
jgi:hypothetical protein